MIDQGETKSDTIKKNSQIDKKKLSIKKKWRIVYKITNINILTSKFKPHLGIVVVGLTWIGLLQLVGVVGLTQASSLS